VSKVIVLALLLAASHGVSPYAIEGNARTLSGKIYFTNDTPRDFDTFPVELYSRNQKRRLIARKANAHGQFKLTGIKPGKYLLKFTWPPHRCTLWYRVDVTTDSKTSIRVIMDAACAHSNGLIQDLSDN
jgi:hypothetical protein